MQTSADDQGVTSEDIQVSIEDLGPCKKKLAITIAAERITGEFRDTYRKLGQTVPVPGFRPGHVPRALLEKKFGEDVRNDVRGTLVPDAFEKALEDNELVAIGEPELDVEAIEVEEGKELAFDVTVEVRPTFELGKFRGLEVERAPVEVTDADVEEALANVLQDRATLVPAEDGVSQDRDLLVVDAAIAVEGEEIQVEENVHYSLPSEVVLGLRVREAPEKLKGRKVEDTETFEIELPANYKDEEHAGKAAELKLTIREIKRLQIPELDDELAQEFDFDDAEDLRDEIESSVRRRKESEADDAVEEALLDQIIENTPFELPEGLVQKELDRSVQRLRVELQMQGATEAEIAERMAVFESERSRSSSRRPAAASGSTTSTAVCSRTGSSSSAPGSTTPWPTR
jgi:trigger factor